MAKSDAERFGHRCPYTDKPCLDFACSECEVEAREERWITESANAILDNLLGKGENGNREDADAPVDAQN